MRIKIGFIILVLIISSLAIAAEKRYDIRIENNPYLGPADAPITIIEFLDFQ
jgi:hypothetical protein